MDYKVLWSDIPEELLALIAKCFDTRIDSLRFRAVCTSWRSSCHLSHNYLSPHLPLKIPSPLTPPSYCYPIHSSPDDYYLLVASAVFLLKPPKESNNCLMSSPSSSSWLFKVEELNSGNLLLRNPLAEFGYHIGARESPTTFNLWDADITEISKAYSIRQGKLSADPDVHINIGVDKLFLFSNPARPTDNPVVVVLFGGILRFLRLGDDKWTRIPNGCNQTGYDDFVNYKGQICAIDRTGRAVLVDYNSMNVTDIASPPSPIRGACLRRKRLVESSGDLFLVVSHYNYFMNKVNNYDEDINYHAASIYGARERLRIGFEVYKLNEDTHNWVQIKSLGDQMYFVGADYSFSVSARHFSGCKGNCIVFTRRSFAPYNSLHDTEMLRGLIGPLGIGVFHLEDGTTFGSLRSYFKIFCTPTWVKPNPYWIIQLGSSQTHIGSSKC